MIRLLFLIVVGLFGLTAYGQNFEKTFSASGVETVRIDFDYPELIEVRFWNRDEVSVIGSVNINMGKNNDRFTIEKNAEGKTLQLTSRIAGLDDLPRSITIKKGDEKVYFNTDDFNDPKVKAFIAENGDYQYYQKGVMKEIRLTLTVPSRLKLELHAKYGIVEIKDPARADILVNAKYGAVDVSLPSSTNRTMKMRTKYGEIYSDLDLKVNGSNEEWGINKWTTVNAKLNNGGPVLDLESKYGNVFVRKTQ